MCQQSLNFYELVDGEYIDVTKNILPEIDFTVLAEDLETEFEIFNPLYELPLYSTTIRIYNQFGDKDLFNLHWESGRFTVEQLYH